MHLREGSPLIDAGDPRSHTDADGSRTDIGTFAYDPHYTSAPEPSGQVAPPGRFTFDTLWPNPFNGATSLSLTLPRTVTVEVTVVDILGRTMVHLTPGQFNAGKHAIALDLVGKPSGVYLVRIDAGTWKGVRKAVLVK